MQCWFEISVGRIYFGTKVRDFHTKYFSPTTGASIWNHKGSGALSLCVLLLTIAALVYETSFYVSVSWAKPEQTLSLLNRFTIFVLLISHSILCLSSMLRSMLRSAVPYLSWASTLNARFIIRRAQILDLPGKGMKRFLPFFKKFRFHVFISFVFLLVCVSVCSACLFVMLMW